jgi:hypothetical protein
VKEKHFCSTSCVNMTLEEATQTIMIACLSNWPVFLDVDGYLVYFITLFQY